MKHQYSIEQQWQFYLEKVGLSETNMGADQLRETKRAFYGACGIILLLARDKISDEKFTDSVKAMQSLLNQVGDFWEKQT